MHRWFGRAGRILAPCVATACGACGAGALTTEPQTPATVVQIPSAPPSSEILLTAATSAAPEAPGPRAPVLDLGGVHPGMTVDELRRVLGSEAKSESYDAVRASWEGAGYDTTAQIEFLVEFDKVLTYNEGNARTKLPFWSIYASNGRVSLMKVTMYVPGTGPVAEAGFPPSCFLTHDPTGIQETFGDGYVMVESQEQSHTSFHYLERGISVLSKDSQIAVFDIYLPITGPRRDVVARALLAPSQRATTP